MFARKERTYGCTITTSRAQHVMKLIWMDDYGILTIVSIFDASHRMLRENAAFGGFIGTIIQ